MRFWESGNIRFRVRKYGSLFFFYRDPNFAGIVGVLHVCRRIDFKLYAVAVLVIALREEFAANSPIDIGESFGHLPFALKNGIGMGGNVDDIQCFSP